MALAPILNPDVPFHHYLPITLVKNCIIYVTGLCHGEQFVINLETDSGDKALHFNPRFNEGQVVRNSLIGGGWGGEERHGGFPFSQNQMFEVRLHIRNDHYDITVNGSPFAEFSHRIPSEAIRHLVIDGQVQLFSVRIQSANPYGAVPVPSGPSYPIFNPGLPFIGGISGGVYKGRIINISGVPTGNSFVVNLQSGDGSNIGLHFNVRFNHGGDYNVVVRNSCHYGGWGGEEREHSHFPFANGVPFDITIYVTDDEFKVAVNSEKFTKFKHRLPLDSFDHLKVGGDVYVTMIQYL